MILVTSPEKLMLVQILFGEHSQLIVSDLPRMVSLERSFHANQKYFRNYTNSIIHESWIHSLSKNIHKAVQ